MNEQAYLTRIAHLAHALGQEIAANLELAQRNIELQKRLDTLGHPPTTYAQSVINEPPHYTTLADDDLPAVKVPEWVIDYGSNLHWSKTKGIHYYWREMHVEHLRNAAHLEGPEVEDEMHEYASWREANGYLEKGPKEA